MKRRRFPTGIQSFRRILEGNCRYVDKTDLMTVTDPKVLARSLVRDAYFICPRSEEVNRQDCTLEYR